MGRKTASQLQDCRTGREFVSYVERTEQAFVMRNRGSTAGIATAAGAVGVHEDDQTLSRESRAKIVAALVAIGISVLVLVFLVVPAVQALGAG